MRTTEAMIFLKLVNETRGARFNENGGLETKPDENDPAPTDRQ